MSSNYYNMREAKVRIAHELMNRGWKVEGYKADESDSMTDYYSPAHWGGIATKNGYILVVDNNQDAEAKEIKKYNYTNTSFEDREKISKLEAMTQERGCTAGEEENAKALIEKIKNKESEGVAQWEVIGMTTAHMGNPSTSKWHIEKDGKIYDKGTGITKYADLPEEYMYDIIKMEFKPSYEYTYEYEWINGERETKRIKRTITEEQKKLINSFKTLILKFERIASGINPMGDGTKETEAAGKEQQVKTGYEKVIKTITKKVIKPVEKEDKTICKDDVLSFKYHGHYWIITDIYTSTQGQERISYELLGSEKRGYQRLSGTTLTGKRYYAVRTRLEKEIAEGTTKIYTLQEVEEKTEVEKWEKIDKTKKTNNTTKETKQEGKTEQATTEGQPTESIINHEYTITADTDTRDNSPLWVVKIIDKLSNEEYKSISNSFKTLKGYYSKFKKGFIFKYNPTEALKGTPEQTTEEKQTEVKETINNNITAEQQATTETENTYEQEKIEEGYIYNAHFKEWDLDMATIENYLNVFEIPFYNMGCKVGFEGLTEAQTIEAKAVNDLNGSIFFIDSKTPITANNSITEEQPEQQEQDEEINNIIDFEDYKNNNEVEEVEQNNDDIFSKFDDIEINNNSRISADDEKFCITEQEQYNKAINTLTSIFNIIFSDLNIDITADRAYSTQKSNNPYLDYYDFDKIVNKKDELKSSFIHSIIRHFTEKYKITIDSYNIVKKYDKQDINYKILLDEIFLQLDGFNFTEKAEKEIKDKLKSQIRESRDWRTNKTSWNIEIKNKKLIFTDLIYPTKNWDNKYEFNGNSGMTYLCKALSLFDCNSLSIIYRLEEFCRYTVKDWAFDIHDLNMNKVITMKIYKNRKIELEFKTSEYARYFAKEYCGYSEQNIKSA
jgi:hypothetical protein